jgi:hypothetical protein
LLSLTALAALPLTACSKGDPSDDTISTSASDATGSDAPTTPAEPTVTGGGPVPFRPHKVMLGAYLDLHGLSLGRSLALRRRQLGREERIVHAFYAWTDDLPRRIPEAAQSSTALISWRGTSYDKINRGAADRVIATAAKRLAKDRTPVLVRWAWEMNDRWYRTDGADRDRDTAGYIAAWRRLHRIFGEQGASNVSWVWSPSWNFGPGDTWDRTTKYYPGDKYVDWVGASGYNLDTETPQDLFGEFYAIWSTRKPIMITEVGASDRGGRTKADWITDFAAWVKANPAVGGVVWFDTDTNPESKERWRVDSSAASLVAYRAMARDPWFGG